MTRFASIAAILMLSACMPKVYKPDFTSNTEVKAEAMVSVFGTEQETGWLGTGWYIASMGNASVIATAGHVCNEPGNDLPGGYMPVTVDKVAYGTITGQDAYPIYDHATDPDDVCLMFVPNAAPSVLNIARGFSWGDTVHYMGYPDGQPGVYTGYLVTEDEGFTAASIPGFFGSSGSAVVNDDNEVVGMLVKGDMTFTNHAWLVPIDLLKKAQTYAEAFLVRYAQNPFVVTEEVLSGKAIDTDPQVLDQSGSN